MDYTQALLILAFFSQFRVSVVTGSLAVRAWLEYTLTKVKDSTRRAELQKLLSAIQVNDLDVVVGDNRKYFDGPSIMRDSIGSYIRHNGISRSCKYSDGMTSFDLIYSEGCIPYVEFNQGTENIKVITPEVLLSNYEDIIDILSGEKRKQADLKIVALKIILESLQSFSQSVEVQRSVPALRSRLKGFNGFKGFDTADIRIGALDFDESDEDDFDNFNLQNTAIAGVARQLF